MRKFLSKIIITCLIFSFLWTGIAKAQVWQLWEFFDDALLPMDILWELGRETERIAKGWFTDLDVSGVFTLGGTVGPSGINFPDNVKAIFGTGNDAAIYYDGANLIIDPKEVGAGTVDLNGDLHTDRWSGLDHNTLLGVGVAGAGNLNPGGVPIAQFNTAFGYQTMYEITDGIDNSAFGYRALHNLTTGLDNFGMGYQSLFSLTEGDDNVAIGQSALYDNILGDNNTAVGSGAGYTVLGSGNVFLGDHAGYNETGSNTLYIANSSTATPLIYGDFSVPSLTINGAVDLVANNFTTTGTLSAGATTVTSLTIPTTGEINFRDTDISIGSTLFDGILDMSADISIDMFYDNADVGDGVDGQSLNINRRAGEGDDYISLYVDKDRKGLIGFSGDNDLLQLAANALTINGNLTTSGTIEGGILLSNNGTSTITIGGAATAGYSVISNMHLILQSVGAGSDMLFKSADWIVFQPTGETDDYAYWAASGGDLYLDTAGSADLYIRADDDLFLQPDGGITLSATGNITLQATNTVEIGPTNNVNIIPGGDVILNPTGVVQIPNDYLGVGIAAPTNPLHLVGIPDARNAIMQVEATAGNYHTYVTLNSPNAGRNVGTLIYYQGAFKWYAPDYVVGNNLRYYGLVRGANYINMYDAGPIVYNEGGNALLDIRMESDTEDYMFFLDAGTNTIRMGDGNGANYMEVSATGDVVFAGTGGLPYGEIWAHSVAADITSVAQNDWDQITAFDTNGASNNTTPDHTNDHITITKAGQYLVSFHWCGSTAAVPHTWAFHISKNNNTSQFDNVTSHVTTPVAARNQSVSATGIIDLAVDDTIELWVKRVTAGANIVLTTDNCDITLTQIGG